MLREIRGFTSDVTALAVSPDDRHILTGDGVGRCRLLRVDTGEIVWESRQHSAGITAVAFMSSGKRVLTASLDNSVAQWDVATGQEELRHVLKHPKPVTALACIARWDQGHHRLRRQYRPPVGHRTS